MTIDPFRNRATIEQGRVVETARVPLWCHDTGGDGEPLVLLGGFTAGHFVFDHVRDGLAGRRLITWEPRGLGASARPDPTAEPYSVALWADDLAALLDALDLPRVQLWATGFGSYIAHRFAAVHPERVGALLTYSDVWAGDEAKAYPKIWEVYGAITRNFGTTGFGARVLANVFDVSDLPWFGVWEARNVEEVLHPETVDATVGYCLTRADVRDELSAIAAPTCVLQGSRAWDGSPLRPQDDPSLTLMRERIARFELATIPDAHPAYVLAQRPAEAAAAAVRFLDAHPLTR
ncbi:alpha/beta fold hydrolase [Patulibacter defluvii]|uniref:alpha/beta fold hydrolase n=1 Tax=Patulibacter defluvii TaxID=3095358 RepID=UPI002A7503F4|nr:alpha/beta hydrolase [Patulibacter sp. DM4]